MVSIVSENYNFKLFNYKFLNNESDAKMSLESEKENSNSNSDLINNNNEQNNNKTNSKEILSPPRIKRKTSTFNSPLSKKDLGTPTRLSVSKVRKKHIEYCLDTKQLSGSPIRTASKQKFDYGFCKFSNMALQYRIKNAITPGRNVAIIAFKHIDQSINYIFAATVGRPGGPHAELIAYDLLPDSVRSKPENILTVYSERKPCTKGSNCYRKLKLVIAASTEVLWSVDFPENLTLRKKVEGCFQMKLVRLGVKPSTRLKKFQKNLAL